MRVAQLCLTRSSRAGRPPRIVKSWSTILLTSQTTALADPNVGEPYLCYCNAGESAFWRSLDIKFYQMRDDQPPPLVVINR